MSAIDRLLRQSISWEDLLEKLRNTCTIPEHPPEPDNDDLALRYVVGYTDYPFDLAGDVNGHKAPIRLCWILDYDRDKYVNVEVVGVPGVQSIKRGYVYKTAARAGEGTCFSHEELCKLLKDDCEVCDGKRGGALGNENIVDGTVMCDYCHADHIQAKKK